MISLRTAWKYVSAATLGMALAVALVFSGPPEKAAAYSGWGFPCSGYGVTGYHFGQYVSGWGYHVGEDTCNQAGQPIYAAADGTVMYSARTPDSYRWGNLILIQHDNSDGSTATGIYGHLSNDRRVAAGQTVTKGQLIGFVGPSWTGENGNWSAHLHFGIRTGGYGAGVGTYAPGIAGYRSGDWGPYAHPTNYIRGRIINYDYKIVGTFGHGVYGKNAEYYVDFHLRNTGNATWYHNGPSAMKLGTTSPRDRQSGFSVGMIGHGWSSSSRIALMADTPPGGTGVFRARFSNQAIQPGGYVERFEPVIDGQGWLGNKDLSVGVNVQPPRYAAQWVSQAAYTTISPTNTAGPTDASYLLPGQRLNLKAYVRNSGDVPWTSSGPNPVRLGTARGNDRGSAFATGGVSGIPNSENWPWYNRPSGIDGRYDQGSNTITPTGTINPGEIAVFSFAITAPNQPGDYREYFNPVVEGRGWMNDLGMWYRLRVLPPGHHYEWVTQENPSSIQLGRTSSTARLYLRNVGQSDWSVGGNVRLGTDRGRDRSSAFSASWPSANRAAAIDANVTNPGDNQIRPGNIARFTFSVQSQTVRDGVHREYLRPVIDGVGWMPEDYGIFVPITVSSPARDYKVLSQSFSTDISTLNYGEEFTARLAVRNLGRTPWNVGGATPTRLGTEQPRDRDAGFSVLTGEDPWINTKRASGIDAKVTNLNPLQTAGTSVINQGEIAYISLPLKVPNGLPFGTYNEHFNFVEDGVAWFPDLGIFFPFIVSGGLIGGNPDLGSVALAAGNLTERPATRDAAMPLPDPVMGPDQPSVPGSPDLPRLPQVPRILRDLL